MRTSGLEDNPVDKLFPKMAACEVQVWGTTGIVNEAGKFSAMEEVPK